VEPGSLTSYIDYYNEGAMDLITYVSLRLSRINQLNILQITGE
jgi:hypothetical protein